MVILMGINIRELSEKIEGHVNSLGLKGGDRIPKEFELSTMFGVTRHQVRNALAILKEKNGWVQIQGSGTYLPGGEKPARVKEKTIAFIGSRLTPEVFPWVETVQREAYKQGYQPMMLSVSHANSKFERESLQFIIDRHITAVCIEPIPIKPCNFDLIDAILENKVKVGLLNAPQELREKYSIYMLNHYKAAYLGAVDLIRKGAKKLILVSSLLPKNDYPWQHIDFRAGFLELVKSLDIPHEIVYANVHFNDEIMENEWNTGSQPIPMKPECGYLCNTVSQALFLQKTIAKSKAKDAPIFAASYRKRNYPFPYALLDEDARMMKMLEYLTDGTIPPVKKVFDVTDPVVVYPN
jgi:hypothetical protein